jgi:ornithine carbamoyltransferase
MRDLLSIKSLTTDEVYNLIDLAMNIKKNPDNYSSRLHRKNIALLFQKTSTRTRISFQSGIFQLGGESIYLDWTTTNLHLGSLPDEIKCISLYVDLIIARVYEHKILEIMKKAADIPIINGLSDKYHPCQILSDLMTIREIFGTFDDISISYIGDGNNVCNSLLLGCTKVELPINVATPAGYEPHKDVLNWIKKHNKEYLMHLKNDPREAVKDADIVYTDTFVSMGQESEKEQRLKIFKPYQINSELLSYAKKKPYIMHCLPAHRGIEITDQILDSERSIVFKQARNRLHLQKALLINLFK